MAQASTTINIRNNSGSKAWIVLQHQNSTNGLQSAVWYADPGQVVGPMTVYFQTGNAVADYWYVYLGIIGGDIYTCGGTLVPGWQECMLMHQDNGQTYTLQVSTTQFNITTYSNDSYPVSSTNIPFSFPITNVFVLMLENHSLDNMLGLSGITGITPMTTNNYNTYNGNNYYVAGPAQPSMPTDPGHEFADVLQQLTNTTGFVPPLGNYPPIAPNPDFSNSSGFAANYATTTDEGDPPPSATEIVDIMQCFSPAQVPAINQLANEFAVCSQWFSSLPGPTWPNRFFVHLASSDGLDCSPSGAQIGTWESGIPSGFTAPNGSIYNRLDNAGIPYCFYNDSYPLLEPILGGYSMFSDDPLLSLGELGGGYVPQVSSLSGVTMLDINSLNSFPLDLQSPYPYPYTFIEPHYGNLLGGTYQGGSSQHPLDDVAGGEKLIQWVYNAIRNSPIWSTSLLVITYDEHGGFYDSVPPVPATPPGDGSPGYGQSGSYNVNGFLFDQYGIRVPAVIVSPFVNRGVVDNTLYDHSTVPATLEALFGLAPLTNRDAGANNLLPLLNNTLPRENCLPRVDLPEKPKVAKKTRTSAEQEELDNSLLPASGNEIGTLQILLKTEIELSGETALEKAALVEKVKAIKTRGQAKAYAASVMKKVAAAKAARLK